MTRLRAIVVADGGAPTREALTAAWPGWDLEVGLVIAADGGARLADALGLTIDRWVGDGDSLGSTGLAELRARGLVVEPAPVEKDASDTELALLAAVEMGATEIVIIGALGGARPDHALANVALLGHPAATGSTLSVLDATARIRLLDAATGDLDLSGRVGDVVSLIPLDHVTGVSTVGLRYELRNDTLPPGPSRGISNVRDTATARVSIEGGRLLVVESPARLLP